MSERVAVCTVTSFALATVLQLFYSRTLYIKPLPNSSWVWERLDAGSVCFKPQAQSDVADLSGDIEDA